MAPRHAVGVAEARATEVDRQQIEIGDAQRHVDRMLPRAAACVERAHRPLDRRPADRRGGRDAPPQKRVEIDLPGVGRQAMPAGVRIGLILRLHRERCCVVDGREPGHLGCGRARLGVQGHLRVDRCADGVGQWQGARPHGFRGVGRQSFVERGRNQRGRGSGGVLGTRVEPLDVAAFCIGDRPAVLGQPRLGNERRGQFGGAAGVWPVVVQALEHAQARSDQHALKLWIRDPGRMKQDEQQPRAGEPFAQVRRRGRLQVAQRCAEPRERERCNGARARQRLGQCAFEQDINARVIHRRGRSGCQQRAQRRLRDWTRGRCGIDRVEIGADGIAVAPQGSERACAMDQQRRFAWRQGKRRIEVHQRPGRLIRIQSRQAQCIEHAGIVHAGGSALQCGNTACR